VECFSVVPRLENNTMLGNDASYVCQGSFFLPGARMFETKRDPKIKRMGSMGDLYFHGHSDCISQNY